MNTEIQMIGLNNTGSNNRIKATAKSAAPYAER